MFALKFLLKVLLLPIYLLMKFISFMIMFASSMGALLYGLFFFVMILFLAFIGFGSHDWLSVGIGLFLCFLVYLSGFAVVLLNGVLIAINDRMTEFMLS